MGEERPVTQGAVCIFLKSNWGGMSCKEVVEGPPPTLVGALVEAQGLGSLAGSEACSCRSQAALQRRRHGPRKGWIRVAVRKATPWTLVHTPLTHGSGQREGARPGRTEALASFLEETQSIVPCSRAPPGPNLLLVPGFPS